MTRYSRSFLFPDLNVWIALTYTRHSHYRYAHRWFISLPSETLLAFCRFTQVGFLRLITTRAVMGDEVCSQAAAWEVYDDWLRNGGVTYLEEPPLLESEFRSLTQSRTISPKEWADAYLAAFASMSELCLVTFDRGFQGKTKELLILRPK